ncbi:hypothetical protein [uncultured Aquimarina sp.]|uniref:hypothetical protein n=1 Tax=uncultured Aquimarina sp. TaxID=575652 RepID=UPI0026124252|nr:hypothetical protein [uncultured Aquimarina sp.]
MKKNKIKPSHRIIAVFFTITFLQTLIPYNQLWANNNGPNAPEAAAFEPVDATDMVNLLTGDMSYVLPLMNIPSPEGGYPLALSYHAGIAMDLDASWVGLGWSLNPGVINRNVNGFPDDWGSSKVSHFFYDNGAVEEYYDVGIGANIYGVNVGVGAYWGSNKTFGGSVTLGYGPVSGTIEAGTRGVGIGAQYGLLSAGVSTNGVNVGLGLNTSNGGGSINYNYNYKSGISSSGSINGNFSGLGISFNSSGSMSSGINSFGGGISNSTSNVSSGDYGITTTSKGLNFDLYLFRVNVNKTRIKYSLFKEVNDQVSGILYPYANRDGLSEPSNNIVSGTPMDVNEIIGFDENGSLISLINKTDQIGLDHLLYPSYDNYSVNAQGISGSISPMFLKEINLYANKKEGSNERMFYHLGNNNDPTLKLNNNLFFYFKNTQSSFFRTDRNNIQLTSDSGAFEKMKNAYTTDSQIYNSNNNTSGNTISNNYRKRTGNFIETFTNENIKQGQVDNNFIEASGINRLNDTTGAFPADGIGAFRVTALDGKTYHYSLPVYNHELYYKNFKNKLDENENFYENSKRSPFATHWLLTAITGPDYFDKNNNNKVDKEDYGYWVEFDYGKWTDGYIWNSAQQEYDIVKGDYDYEDTYEYYRGRKQIYYLDAIKTRTHTAYFIKSLRGDAKGEDYTFYKNKITPTNSNVLSNSKKFKSNKKRDYFLPGDYNTPTFVQDGDFGYYICTYKGYDGIIRYADYPRHFSLKLDKIVLVNNDSGIEIDKSYGAPLSNVQEASYYNNRSFEVTDSFSAFVPCGVSGGSWSRIGSGNYYQSNNFNLKKVKIHNSHLIIDSNDIIGLNLEKQAIKTVSFNYDSSYPLTPNSPNSDAPTKGKLTLNKINFGGHEGKIISPSYSFSYSKPSIQFDKDKEDAWGFHEDHPDAWSLNKIKTPTGGEISIEYESDDYYKEAIKSNRVFNKGLSYLITSNQNFTDLYFDITKNDHPDANDLEDFQDFNDYFELGEDIDLNMFICRRSRYGGHRRQVNLNLDNVKGQIIQVSTNSVKIKVPNNTEFWYFDDQDQNWILNRNWSLTDVTFANNSADGVIMRDLGLNQCQEWRASYDNDDVNFHSQISSSKIKGEQRGGGIRVKNIVVSDGILENKINYSYNDIAFNEDPNHSNYRSSGITSYAPSNESKPIPYVSELPSPLVTYSNVTVRNIDSNNHLISKSEYDFETLQPYENNSSFYALGDHFKVERVSEDLPDNLNLRNYKIINNLSNLGRLNSLRTYNSKGNLLFEKTNTYSQSQDIDFRAGVSQESYLSKSITEPLEFCFPIHSCNTSNNVVATSRINYPSVLESTTTSEGGFTNTTNYDNHDFLTGQVTETRSTSSEGTEFKTKVTPAYYIDNYTNNTDGYSMGAKVDNPTNKNMLTQTTATLTQLKDGNTWKTINSSINTWNNEWTYRNYNGSTTTPINDVEKIWRKHKTFAWKGELDEDGTYLGYTGNDDNFNWSDPDNQSNSEWINTSTVNLYDHYSMPLESKDINGNKTSTKMGDDNSKVFAVANAGYTEMYYSGAEDLIPDTDYFSGEVSKGSTATLSDIYHTGTKAVEAPANVRAFAVTPEAGNYKVSVWVYKGANNSENYTNTKLRADGAVISHHLAEIIPAGDWVQLNFYTGDISNGQEVYIYNTSGTTIYDDFRLLPIASSMTSYVYNEWDELSYIIGANNLATKYEYDATGRLKKTYTEVMDTPEITGGFKLNKEINYNYGSPTTSNTTNPNTLTLSLGIGDPNVSTTTLTATAGGGSFEYEYRFAIGTSSSNLSYGGWSSSNTKSLTTSCATGGRRHYKCQVRDKNYQTTTERSGNHQRGDCGIDGDGDGDPINQQ